MFDHKIPVHPSIVPGVLQKGEINIRSFSTNSVPSGKMGGYL